MIHQEQQPKRYLTKSRFKMAVECPRKLVYTGRESYIDTKKTSDLLKGLAEGGFQIGALAQVIYAQEADLEGVPWKEIKGNQEAQIEETRKALQQQSITLFEATIQVGQFLVRVDVLRKRGNRLDLIEVKSKSVDTAESGATPIKKPEYLPYLQDIAFQTMVVRQANPGPEVHSLLMMPDKAKVTTSAGLHELFPVQFETINGEERARVDMPPQASWAGIDHGFMLEIGADEEVATILDGTLKTDAPGVEGAFAALAAKWASDYAAHADIEPVIGSKNCGNCEFYNPTPDETARSGFHECWARKVKGFATDQLRETTVLGLYNDRSGLKKSQIEKNKYFLNEIQQPDLKWEPIDSPISNAQRQWMQISSSWPGGGDHYFDRQNFESERRKWVFPYQFLDFEGARSALPFRPGQHPNAINAFQYSLHLMHADGRVEHKSQFLELEQTGNPNAKFLRQLRKDLGEHGTVFRWHEYEKTVLEELRSELTNAQKKEPDYPELIEFINSLVQESSARYMVDQSKIAQMFYFHPDTRGSSSIKKVLPAIMGSSKWLKNTYSQAIYGGNGPIPSINYKTPVVWWREDPQKPGKPIDPYDLLASQSALGSQGDTGKICEAAEQAINADGGVLRDGGAAMMAYTRLQSGRLSPDEEKKLKEAMLRYCELDTLAMVMIMQSWINS